jgi:hypothetical protein
LTFPHRLKDDSHISSVASTFSMVFEGEKGRRREGERGREGERERI